ncbi:hypothetical protein JTB14_023141 [Gonioctena quinquepunctata]|nr:hypothetical protein JTB14_023141 [Gonioctena quinquepunctata]
MLNEVETHNSDSSYQQVEESGLGNDTPQQHELEFFETFLEGDITLQFEDGVYSGPEKQFIQIEDNSQKEDVVLHSQEFETQKCGIVPTYSEIIEPQEDHPCLVRRMPPQIKSCIANETKNLGRNNVKRSWPTPQRQIVRRKFRDYLEKKTLPPLSKCEEVIKRNLELSHRSVQTLEAYINNVNRKICG